MLAERHVRQGRAVVERQREIVRRQNAVGADPTRSQLLLEQFEGSLAIFEDDLTRLIAEQMAVGPASFAGRIAATASGESG